MTPNLRARARASAVSGTVALLLLVTLAIDSVTPLGVAIWCLYFVCVGLTLFQPRPTLPLFTAIAATAFVALGWKLSPQGMSGGYAVINRAIGVVSFWAMAIVVWQALCTRRSAERLLWLQEGQAVLAEAMRGEQTPETVAVNAVRALAERVGAVVGALYRLEGNHLMLAGGVALDGSEIARIPVDQGLLGETLGQNRVRRLRGVQGTHLKLSSTLGHSAPVELMLMPVTADGVPVGAVELGRLKTEDPLDAHDVLLAQSSETVGIALRTAMFRQRQAELLEETQRQSEELQTQQEELRVSNEELEEQSRSLQQSQASLEAQQAELEQINVQLEERTHELEGQKQALVRAQGDLTRNALSLEATSRYKSEFLANMSHELRTPLNSSLILAKLLADNKPGSLTPEQVKYAQAIHASNNDLLALINDILDLSKIEAGHVELAAEPVPIAALIDRLRDTFEPLCREKSLALIIDQGVGVPAELIGDMQRLLQILKNLLANALKFTDVGSISLRIEGSAPGRIRFVVCDTGIGISAEQSEIIFEAFRQADGSTSRKFGGTGLGLSISRDLARRMDGDITVASEPGRGSCFTLDIAQSLQHAVGAPAVGAAATLPAVPVIPSAPSPAPMHTPLVRDDRTARTRPGRLILAVEDDSAFAEALIHVAHEMDFDCVVAGTAEEALRLAPELTPSGILLDIGLPDVSGLSVLERLKRNPATRHIPVHVVSALERGQVSLELGAVGHLLKPASRERLMDAIGQLEDRHQRAMRRLLIVEDDEKLRDNLTLLLTSDQVDIVAVGTIAAALRELGASTFDCMVTDLALPDGSGYDLLEKLAGSDSLAFPPVIVYTGRSLTRDEEQRLRRYSKSIIIKGARSPERLLDEVTLFLHSVEASLPTDQQRLLKAARQRDSMLDGRTFLLAEDDVRNIFALTSVLEPLGVKLDIARNGVEALEHLKANEPDLVLMDIMMPEMDGMTAMRHIRAEARWKDLPIIALTAKAMTDDRDLCLASGANDYIAKPIDVDKLVSLCRVWCSRR
ncbi:response regulator [Luteibacter sp. 9133]|uniref:hybrid sensor histidine kinase/response regulator n=1 Tax=Luteibacter sp. 9133 TaxID=1500891 RepID=UPI0006921DB9|nr:response regulator [Luteibacter sp. 9133]